MKDTVYKLRNGLPYRAESTPSPAPESQKQPVVEVEIRSDNSTGEIHCAEDLTTLPVNITSLTVHSCDDYKQELLTFSRFANLETLHISSKCFTYSSRVEIVDMHYLTSIVVDDDCFTADDANAAFVVTNCHLLQSLSIGNRSFSAFKQLVLSQLPLLEKLTIGSQCFVPADFTVRSMDQLVTIQLGEGSFEKAHHSVVEGCLHVPS